MKKRINLITVLSAIMLLLISCSEKVGNKLVDVELNLLIQTEKSLSASVNIRPARFQYMAVKGDTEKLDNWTDVSTNSQNSFESIKINKLEEGDWTFYVRAFNSSDNIIYQGKITASVTANKENVFLIHLSRVNSDVNGRLSFSVHVPLYKNEVPQVYAKYRRVGEFAFTTNNSFAVYGEPDYQNQSFLMKGYIDNIPEGLYEFSLVCSYGGKDVGGDFILVDVVGLSTTFITGNVDGILIADRVEIDMKITDILPFVWDSDKIIIGFYDYINDKVVDLSGSKVYRVCSYSEKISDIKSLDEIGIEPVYADKNTDLSMQKFMIIGSNVPNLSSSLERGWIGNTYMSLGINQMLEELYVNQNITTGALMHLRELRKLVLGPSENFTLIETNALLGSVSIKSIIIPENIKTIRTEAFMQSGIKTVYCRIWSTDEPETWETGWNRGVSSVIWRYTGD